MPKLWVSGDEKCQKSQLDLAKVPEEAEDKCERARAMEGNRGEVDGRELCDHRGANMREKILYMLWSNYGEEKLLKLTLAHSLCLQTQAGLAMAVPVQKNQQKKKKRKKKEKNDEDLFGVLMLLFYFYTGVYGGDHVEPTAAICAIISEWNATETLILRVYIYIYVGNDYGTFPALC